MALNKHILPMTEKAALCILFVLIFLALIYQPSEPVFMGEFNNKDGSIYAARLVDCAVALVIFLGVAFFLVPRFLTEKKVNHFIVWSLFILLITTVASYFMDHLLLRLFNLPTGPNQISDKMLQYPRRIVYKAPVIPGSLLIYALGMLYGISRDWLLKSRRHSQLARERMRADIDLLRSQINPHFFFNALNNIYAITQKHKDREAGEAIMRLSAVMRYMIYDSGVETIGLDTEVEQMQRYMELMRLRYAEDDPLDIRVRCHDDVSKLRIAPLLLLPFVENAFKHGINAKGEGFIHIDILVCEKQLKFRVSNSRAGQTNPFREHSGIGLDNVKKRLDLQYPDQYTLDISDEAEIYTVELTIHLE